MEKLKYFFDCYFHLNEDVENLYNLIEEFKREPEVSVLQFIKELHQIMHTRNYLEASRIIEEYGYKILNIEQTERVLTYIYKRLIDQPAVLDMHDFYNDCKTILCPVCSPRLVMNKTFSLIDKATVITNNLQIYICRPCKLVWLTENIRKNNAQDYKKFMRTLGLKGLWKELKDIDYL